MVAVLKQREDLAACRHWSKNMHKHVAKHCVLYEQEWLQMIAGRREKLPDILALLEFTGHINNCLLRVSILTLIVDGRPAVNELEPEPGRSALVMVRHFLRRDHDDYEG